MKKKFKRLVEKETAAKFKRRRIISAFLAAFMFVSGGSFGKIAQVGFTVSAEDLYDEESPPGEEDDDNTEEEDGTDNDTEQEYESTDEDYETDYYAEQEDESSDENGESTDDEEEMTDEEGDAEFDELYKNDIDILADGDDKIRIKPVYVGNNPNTALYEKWQTNNYSETNPYVLKSDSSFTLCGTMSGVAVHKTGVDCDDNCDWTQTTNGYCIDKDSKHAGNFWFTPNNTDQNNKQMLDQVGDITREAVLEDVLGADGKPTGEKISTGEVRVYVTYKAGTVTKDNMFNGIITFDNGVPYDKDDSTSTSTWEQFHVSVRPSFIKVYTDVGERDMDKVNEFVESIFLGLNQAYQVHDDYIWNSVDTPYRMFPGESVSIRDISGNSLGDVDGVTKTTTTINGIQYATYEPNETKGYVLKYDTGCTDGKGNPITEEFYFSVEKDATLDHADIEISDKNTYTVVNEVLEKDENGNDVTRKYEIVYDVYVSDIDHSVIYSKNVDADGKKIPLVLKDQYYDNYDFENGTGEYITNKKDHPDYQQPRMSVEGIIPHDDYWKDLTKKPGDPQFELTSKYELDKNHYLIFDSTLDNLRFKMSDVGTVDFHVQLYLKPSSVTVYDENNQECTGSAYNIADLSSVTIDNVVFEMNHQSVLDAYNKCPDHSGLDFTFNGKIEEYIVIEPTDIAFEAQKILENNPNPNGELEKEKFKFKLYYVSGPDKEGSEDILLGTFSNNIDGKIYFSSRNLTEEGEYKYRIEEVIDENDNTIKYDEGYIDVVVKVTKTQTTTTKQIGITQVEKEVREVTFVKEVTYSKHNSDGSVVNQPTFTNTYNTKYYTLPSAGGPGVYIYIISGAGFILAAAVMFYRKRRKEACFYQ